MLGRLASFKDLSQNAAGLVNMYRHAVQATATHEVGEAAEAISVAILHSGAYLWAETASLGLVYVIRGQDLGLKNALIRHARRQIEGCRIHILRQLRPKGLDAVFAALSLKEEVSLDMPADPTRSAFVFHPNDDGTLSYTGPDPTIPIYDSQHQTFNHFITIQRSRVGRF